MKQMSRGLIAAALFAAAAVTVHGSSHREALAVLNEPCADNTDTYAWVSNESHDKLYLIMDFNPLHEPGQGNQGLRACNGYRYEFHIGKGKSLKDRVVYRVEFTNTLTPEGGAERHRSAGRRQRAAVAAHRRHRDDEGHPHQAPGRRRRQKTCTTVLGNNLDVLPNNHGPQTDRLVYGLGAFEGYDSGIRRAVKSACTIRLSSTPSSIRSRMAGASSPASSTIRISSTRRGSSISST